MSPRFGLGQVVGRAQRYAPHARACALALRHEAFVSFLAYFRYSHPNRACVEHGVRDVNRVANVQGPNSGCNGARRDTASWGASWGGDVFVYLEHRYYLLAVGCYSQRNHITPTTLAMHTCLPARRQAGVAATTLEPPHNHLLREVVAGAELAATRVSGTATTSTTYIFKGKGMRIGLLDKYTGKGEDLYLVKKRSVAVVDPRRKPRGTRARALTTLIGSNRRLAGGKRA